MKKRAESYFGLHFDFHANESTKDIGGEFSDAVLEEILRKVKPDFVQCDTKGHPGVSSYPTKAGYASPAIKADILKKWREITAKRDVALYAHYSGIFDIKQGESHPEWRAANADGSPCREMMSTFGGYAKQILIPQLIELANGYRLNGAWVDGDCWVAPIDYGKEAQDEWIKTHNCQAPKPGEAGFEKYKAFCRQGFLWTG